MVDLTVIHLQEHWQTCHRCTNDTRSRCAWPYYEEFLFGWADYDPDLIGYVPVCNTCYLELLNQDANDWTSVYGGSGRDRAMFRGFVPDAAGDAPSP